MKYGMWLDEWFRNYIQPSSKIKTCERYSEIIEKHLKVKLGEYELDELTPLVLQRYVTELLRSGNIVTGKGLAANSVNGIITVVQNSLKLAYTLGELKEYTADKFKRPKTKEKDVSCFTLPEQKKIEQAVLTSKKPKLFGIVLCLYSGLRIGELLALEWSDIDFNKGTIIVGSIACGQPVDAVEQIEESVTLPRAIFGGGDLFILHTHGDSMIDIGIKHGDLVLIRKQNTAENGDIIVAMMNGETTLKRFYKRNGKVVLHPENKEMKDIIVKDCEIQGVLVK